MCIAMEFFADRIGGIDDAVHKMSETTCQELYNEAADKDDGVLSVRDVLVYFRNPKLTVVHCDSGSKVV